MLKTTIAAIALAMIGTASAACELNTMTRNVISARIMGTDMTVKSVNEMIDETAYRVEHDKRIAVARSPCADTTAAVLILLGVERPFAEKIVDME